MKSQVAFSAVLAASFSGVASAQYGGFNWGNWGGFPSCAVCSQSQSMMKEILIDGSLHVLLNGIAPPAQAITGEAVSAITRPSSQVPILASHHQAVQPRINQVCHPPIVPEFY